jgi:hypothetical protein
LRHRTVYRIALVCAAALALGACKNSAQIFQDNNEGGWFSKPLDVFAKPSWASATVNDNRNSLGPSGPAAPEELVGADGRCGTSPAEAAQASAAAPADSAVATVAGDLGGAPAATPASATPGEVPPTLMGGVALGMTECDVVRRAGTPSNVSISAGDRGERRVVLTYLTGPWPGIYTFDAGRLNVVDRAPEPPKPAKPVKTRKAKKPAKPKTAAAAPAPVERAFVQ